MDVNVSCRDDDFTAQARRDRLPFFPREPVQMIPQSVAQGGRSVEPLLPMDPLVPRVRQLLTCLRELLPRGRARLTPRLARTQGDQLGLIGMAQALVWPLAALLPLQPLRVWRLQPGEGRLLGCSPGLRQVREQARRLQPPTRRVPDDRSESLSA